MEVKIKGWEVGVCVFEEEGGGGERRDLRCLVCVTRRFRV